MHWTFPLVGFTVNPVLVALLLGVFLIYYIYTKNRYQLPPGPFALPIVGNLPQLYFKKKSLYKYFVDLTKQYGPIFSFQIGGMKCVVLNNIDLVLEATVKKPTDFAGRPRTYTTEIVSNGGKDIIMADYGPTWRLHRKIAYQAMRNYATGENLQRKIHAAFENFSEVIKKSEPCAINDYISFMTYNFICGFCWGQSYDLEDEEFVKLVQLADTLNKDIASGLPEDIFPFLQYLPSTKRSKILKMFREFQAILIEKYESHRDTFDPDNIRDFIDDLLLERRRAAEEEDQEFLEQFTDTHIFQTISDMFGAGTDTTRYTLMMAIYFMLKYPDVQQKIHDEIDRNIGRDRLPEIKDKDKLVYTEGTLMEIMRMEFIVPIGFPHAAMVDSTIGDYDIPKGTTIFLNHWALHKDPDYWKDPDVFDPGRFIDPDGTHAPKPVSFLPFGAGRRVCLGEAVAKPELLMFFACLMQRFHFSVPMGEELLSVEEGSGDLIILPPSNLRAIVTPRD